MITEFTASLFDELESLYPDSDASQGKKEIIVSGANGMTVGAHIMLNGLTPGLPIAVEVKGPHTSFKLFELIPVPVEVGTGARQRSAYLHDDVNESVIRKAPFYVYDALKPIYNLLMPTGVTAAIAFKTLIEYIREYREDTWTITISHAGKVQTLKITVHAYPASVEKAGKTTHKYVNWVSYANIAKYHHVEMDSPAYFKLLDKYLKMAVYLRQNLININVDMFIKYENGEAIVDEARFDKYIAAFKKAGFECFHGTGLCGRMEGQGDNDEFYNSLDHDKIESPEEVRKAFRKVAFDKFDNGTRAAESFTGKDMQTEEGQTVLRACARALYKYLVSRGLEKDWEQCLLDEPNDALADVYKIISKIAHEEMPGILMMEPVLPTHALTGYIDIWCPTIETYENDRAYYDERVQNGDSLYVYTCLTPGGKYLNRMLDMQRLRQTYLGWAPAKYENISGFLHWGYNQFLDDQDPYDRSACMFSEGIMQFHPKLDLFLPAGDFSIVYPGFNTVYHTTRAEAQRIGLEDLCLLEKIDPEKKKEIVDKVFKGYTEYELDVDKYRAAREALLREASKK
ncbi:MAG: DUF4091 domain-containing protein [Clostridiales bacterium]|nr:DUF4091 domain-containing protein [Clostridiales bacterium]